MTEYDMTCDAFADQLADYLEGDASVVVRMAMDAHAADCGACGELLADLRLISQQAAALPPLVPSRDLWAGIAERIDAPVLPLAARTGIRRLPSLRRGWQRPAVAAAALVLFTASVTHVLTRVSMSASSGTTVAARGASADVPVSPSQQVASATPDAGVNEADTLSVATEARAASVELGATPARGEAGRRTAQRVAVRAAGGTTPSVVRGGTVRLVRAEPLLHEVEPVYDSEITKLRRIVRERRSQLDPHTIAVLEQSVAVIDSAIAQSRAALAKDPASGFLATQLNHSLEKKVELLRTAALLPART